MFNLSTASFFLFCIIWQVLLLGRTEAANVGVYAFGQGPQDELGVSSIAGHLPNELDMTNVPLVEDWTVVTLCGGTDFSIALTSTNKLISWGTGNGAARANIAENYLPMHVDESLPPLIGNEKITYLSCGIDHTIIVTSSGRVATVGNNAYLQLGYATAGNGPSTNFSLVPLSSMLAATDFIVACEGGVYATLCLSDQSKLISWGYAAYGTTGTTNANVLIPPGLVTPSVTLAANERIIQIGMDWISFALTNFGNLWTWGMTASIFPLGRAGSGESDIVPTKVNLYEFLPGGVKPSDSVLGCVRVVLSEYACFCILDSGQVLSWGNAAYGELGRDRSLMTGQSPYYPYLIPQITNITNMEKAAGITDTAAINTMSACPYNVYFATASNTLYHFGVFDIDSSVPNSDVALLALFPPGILADDEIPLEVHCGVSSVIYCLTSKGRTLSWFGSRVLSVDTSVDTTLLGRSLTTAVAQPVDLDNFLPSEFVVQLFGTAETNFALTNLNNVYSWGYDFEHALGRRPTAQSSAIPGQLILTNYNPSHGNPVKLSCGLSTASLMLTELGFVYSWGSYGNGRGDSLAVPPDIPTLLAVNQSMLLPGETIADVMINGNTVTTCAFLVGSQGTIISFGIEEGDPTYCMGRNYSDPTKPTALPAPVLFPNSYRVNAATNPIAQVCVGGSHGLALLKDGVTLYGWGDSTYDQVHRGALTQYEYPDVVNDVAGMLMAGETITNLGCGVFFSAVLTSANRVLHWGLGFGAGDGTNPVVQASDLTGLMTIAGEELIRSTYITNGYTVRVYTTAGNMISWHSDDSYNSAPAFAQPVDQVNTSFCTLGRVGNERVPGLADQASFGPASLTTSANRVIAVAGGLLSTFLLTDLAPIPSQITPSTAFTAEMVTVTLTGTNFGSRVLGSDPASQQVRCRTTSVSESLDTPGTFLQYANSSAVECQLPSRTTIGADTNAVVAVSVSFSVTTDPDFSVFVTSYYDNSYGQSVSFTYEGCDAGKFLSGAKCTECQLDTYKPDTGEDCTLCPTEKTTLVTGATSLSQCVCPLGTYDTSEYTQPASTQTDSDSGVKCKDCETGMICNVSNVMSIDPGYWRPDMDSSYVRQCPNAQGCAGTDLATGKDSCATGYRGPLCGACDAKHAQYGTQCVSCESKQLQIGITILLVFFAFLFVYLLISKVSSEDRRSDGTDGVIGVHLKITLNYLQGLYYVGRLSANWSRDSRRYFTVIGQSTLTPNFFSISCAVGWSFYERLVFVYLSPAIIFVVLAIIYLCRYSYSLYKYPNHRDEQLRKWKNNFQLAVMLVLNQIHPSIMIEVIQSIPCTVVKGYGKFLTADFNVSCSSPSYKAFRVISWIYLMVYIFFGYMGVIGYKLHHNAKSRKLFLPDEAAYTKYLFFTKGYREETYYWELVVMTRKLGIAGVSILINSGLQLVWAGFIICASFVATLYLQPYDERFSRPAEVTSRVPYIPPQHLELASLATLYFSVMLGFYYLLSNFEHQWSTFFLVIMNCAMLTVLLMHLIQSIFQYVTQLRMEDLLKLLRRGSVVGTSQAQLNIPHHQDSGTGVSMQAM